MKFGKSIRLQAKSNRGKHYLNFKLLKRKIRAMEEAIHNGSAEPSTMATLCNTSRKHDVWRGVCVCVQ